MKITYDNGLLPQAIFNFLKAARYAGIKYDNGLAKQSDSPTPPPLAGPAFTYGFNDMALSITVRADTEWGQRAMQLLNDVADVIGNGEIQIFDADTLQNVPVTDYIVYDGIQAGLKTSYVGPNISLGSLQSYAQIEDRLDMLGGDASDYFDDIYALACDAIPELYEIDPFITYYVFGMPLTYDDYEPKHKALVMSGYGWIVQQLGCEYFSEWEVGFEDFTLMALYCILNKEHTGDDVPDSLEDYFSYSEHPGIQLMSMFDDLGEELASKDTDEVIDTLEAMAEWFMYVLYDDNMLNMLTMGQPAPSLYTYAANDAFNVIELSSKAYPGSTSGSTFNNLGVEFLNDIATNIGDVYVHGKSGTSNLFCDTALMRLDRYETFKSDATVADVIKPTHLRSRLTLDTQYSGATTAIKTCITYIKSHYDGYFDSYMAPMFYASPFLFLFAFEYINPVAGQTPDIWNAAKTAGVNLANNNQKLTTWYNWLKFAKYATDQEGEFTIIDWLEKTVAPSVTGPDAWLLGLTLMEKAEVLYFLNEQAKLLIETAYDSAPAFFNKIKSLGV